MLFVLENNLVIRGIGLVDYIAIKKLFIVDNPEYVKAKQRGLSTYRLDKYLELYIKLDPYNYIITVPRNGICEVVQYALKNNREYTIIDHREEGVKADFGDLNNSFVLRTEQEAAVCALEKTPGILVAGAGCVDCDTEFFTGIEWKRIADYEEGDKVLQYKENGPSSLVTPKRYIKAKADTLYHVKNSNGIDQVLSLNHNVVYVNHSLKRGYTHLLKKKFSDVIIENVKSSTGFPGLLPIVDNFDDYENLSIKYKSIYSKVNPQILPYKTLDGYQYCFEVPSGMLVLKRNDSIFITGNSGKTVMALAYAARMKRLTLWVTHTQDLLYQAKERAQQMFPSLGEVGIIGDGKLEFGFGNLIVSTFQSLASSKNLIEELNGLVGTVIVDEVHHAPSPFFDEIINSFKARNIIGLTATPERKDQLECKMFLSIGNIVHTVDRSVQYEEKKLIKPKVIFMYTGVSHADVDDNDFGYDAGGEDLDYLALINSVLALEKRRDLIAESIVGCVLNGCKYQIVISDYVSYAYALSARVNELLIEKGLVGVTTAVIHGPIPTYTWKRARSKDAAIRAVKNGDALDYRKDKNGRRYSIKVYNYSPEQLQRWKITGKQRKMILQDCQDRKVNILFATKLAREGLDIKHLEIGHAVTPKRGDTYQRSDGSGVEQEIGRIMRPDPLNPDKKPIWYDYVDYELEVFKSQYYSRRKVYSRLGLDMPKKKKSEIEVTEDLLSKINLFN